MTEAKDIREALGEGGMMPIDNETALRLLQTVEAQTKLVGAVMEGLRILTNTVSMQSRQINELQKRKSP